MLCVRVVRVVRVVRRGWGVSGTAVAHGNGGTGRVLSDFLRTTRLATANEGGGFVNYTTGSDTTGSDKYGTTHGSYVLPVYNAQGDVTHFAGASFSTAPGPPTAPSCPAPKKDETLFVVFLVLSIILCAALVLIGCYLVRGKEDDGYCSLRTNLLENEADSTATQMENTSGGTNAGVASPYTVSGAMGMVAPEAGERTPTSNEKMNQRELL